VLSAACLLAYQSRAIVRILKEENVFVAISSVCIHSPHTIEYLARIDPTMKSPRIILFDGQCNACNKFVQFVIRRDPAANFQFAPLQSEQATCALQAAGFDPLQNYHPARARQPITNAPPTAPSISPTPPTPPPLDSLILICEGKVLLRSDAALAIAGGMRFPWPLLGVLRIVPRGLRDGAYRIFARNRYRWFGQCNVGALSTTAPSHLASRFL
jgi:predicted DCC family thiol-disulfide oxidoreductase YuxK